MSVVKVKNLTVDFNPVRAIDGISLDVNEGEFVAVIGPSGCGKSTLLRAISGIIPGKIKAEVGGTVQVFGSEPSQLSAGKVDMVFQKGNLLPWRTAIENVSLGLEILDKEPQISPAQMLENVGLKDFMNSYPQELSGGMQQRVALCSSLITSPRLFLMDEPFAHLDALTRRKMWQMVVRLREMNLLSTVIMITHMVEEAVVLADRVVIMTNESTQEEKIQIDWPRIGQDGVLAPECSNRIDRVMHQVSEVNHVSF